MIQQLATWRKVGVLYQIWVQDQLVATAYSEEEAVAIVKVADTCAEIQTRKMRSEIRRLSREVGFLRRAIKAIDKALLWNSVITKNEPLIGLERTRASSIRGACGSNRSGQGYGCRACAPELR